MAFVFENAEQEPVDRFVFEDPEIPPPPPEQDTVTAAVKAGVQKGFATLAEQAISLGGEFEKFGERVAEAAPTIPIGIGEAAANLATMTYGVPLAGLGEIADLATGGKYKISEKISQTLIYQPQTKGGELARDILFSPFEAISAVGGVRANTLFDELSKEYGPDDIRTSLYPTIRKTLYDLAGIAVTGKALHRPKIPEVPKGRVELKPEEPFVLEDVPTTEGKPLDTRIEIPVEEVGKVIETEPRQRFLFEEEKPPATPEVTPEAIIPEKPSLTKRIRKIEKEKPVKVIEIPKEAVKKEPIIEEPPGIEIKEEAHEFIRKRRANLDIAAFETNKLINEIERELSPKQREVIPFVIEKTGIPDALKRPDLKEIHSKDIDKLTPVGRKVKTHFDNAWVDIKKHIPDLSTKQIEDYVTHIWDVPKAKKQEVSNWFITQNRFLKKRYIDTLEEGIEKFGLKPKTLDISEIIRIHDSVTHRAIENAKLIKDLSDLKEGDLPLIMRKDKAPEGWVEYSHPAINRGMFLPPEKGVKGTGTLIKVPVKVHPDLVKPLNTVLDSRIDVPIINAYEAINGILKKTNLSISLFHHGALGETGVATMGALKTANIYFNPKKIYDAMVKGEFDVFKKEAVTRDAIENGGVQFGATADIPVAKIQRGLNTLARKTKNVPLLNKVTEFIKTFNSKWDIALWDYLHDTLKLYAYEHLVGKIDPSKDVLKQKREVGQIVNDTFGGQNWDSLMVRPKTIQVASWGLLSPDWTISTVRQALAPTGIGKVYKETAGLRKKMGTKFWLKAGLYFGAGINMLNATFRKADEKKNPQFYKDRDMKFLDYTMVGNAIGQKTRLFVGRYEDGSERYIRWGKQFRELPEMLFDDVGFSPVSASLKKVGGKLAPALQLASQIFTGYSPSGFRNDDIAGKKGWDRTLGIFKTILLSPLPFSSRAVLREDKEFHITDIAMPSSKGMTRYKSIELFKVAIGTGDERLLKETYQDSLRNNLPAYSLFNVALTSLKAQATKEITEGLNTLRKVQEKIRATEDPKERAKLRRTIARLRKEDAEKKRGLQFLRAAIRKAEVFNPQLKETK